MTITNEIDNILHQTKQLSNSDMYIYIYIYICNIYIYIYIYNSTTRHLKYSYISILTNLLRTEDSQSVEDLQESKYNCILNVSLLSYIF